MLSKPLVPHGIDIASRELGAAAYVDYIHIENTQGMDKADRQLRTTLIDACRT
jgi:hypothetical protein